MLFYYPAVVKALPPKVSSELDILLKEFLINKWTFSTGMQKIMRQFPELIQTKYWCSWEVLSWPVPMLLHTMKSLHSCCVLFEVVSVRIGPKCLFYSNRKERFIASMVDTMEFSSIPFCFSSASFSAVLVQMDFAFLTLPITKDKSVVSFHLFPHISFQPSWRGLQIPKLYLLSVSL